MPSLARAPLTFNEIRHPILMGTDNDLKLIGGFASRLRTRWTGINPDSKGVDSLEASGFAHQLEFDAAANITTNRRIP